MVLSPSPSLHQCNRWKRRRTGSSRLRTSGLRCGLDDDLPYLQKYEEGDLIAIPLTIEINDLSHSMRWGRTPRQFVEMFDDALTHLLAAPEDVVILDVLGHTHCYGRPACAWAYAEIAQKCAERNDIWITTRGRIADHFLASVK